MNSAEGYLLFSCLALIMGFCAAIPIGATQLEIARRSLNGYPKSALLLVFGSVLSDSIYGIVALYGIAPFLQKPSVEALFGFINAAILIGLGIWAIRESKKPLNGGSVNNLVLSDKNVSFVTGFSLAVTNPLMIYWWLLGEKLINDLKLINPNGVSMVLFLAAGSAGIFAYLSLLTFGVYKVKKFFSDNAVRKTTIGFSIALLGLSLYFTVRSFMLLNN